MADPPNPVALPPVQRRLFSAPRLISLAVLLAIFIVCVVLSWTSGQSMDSVPFLKARKTQQAADVPQSVIVDLTPWQTAEALAAFAVTSEELEHARQAEHLADHEVDQAFAAALRQASLSHPVLSPQARALEQKIAQLQQTVKDDQAKIQSLTPAAAGTPPQATFEVSDLDIAKAQLELDSDELTDAQLDLERASGDQRARLQQELSAHEAAMQKYDQQTRNGGETAVVSANRRQTLAARFAAWNGERSRYALLTEALKQTRTSAAALAAQHSQFEHDISMNAAPAGDRAASLLNLHNRSTARQILSIYDDRIQTALQLAAVYGNWSDQVVLQRRIEAHLIFQSLGMIVLIVLCMILADTFMRRLIATRALDNRRSITLRTIFKIAIQVAGVLLILLVIFGPPNQMPTIVGLTTAGLTVILQDFILAFLGWFVLIGKNGLRRGDWVEINGISGEVAEVGLLRTVLLETGNWTDKGHPTGRRVTLMNGFAIKGQYFNYSTASQWMWDEITVGIPAANDTYEKIDSIRHAVLAETGKDAQLAEEEWRHATRKGGLALSHFTAGPAVDMRPSASGIDVVVRYVTRASRRLEVRNRLYQTVIDLLHKRETPPA